MAATRPQRHFEVSLAVRESVPLLIGLIGPSGGGKTFSALRLASGIQREMGGDIFVIDTEGRRALHYADRFKFQHVDFNAPFGPPDYLDAIEYCVAKGARNIVVDSMSHEHEGQGGVLEMHEAELERLAGDDWQKRDRVKMLAWAKPKQERRRLLNTILQLNVNFIFCFRAKEKLKIERGKEPVPLGWQAIAGEEFIYEMTTALLLPPAANGVPNLSPTELGERATVKVPAQFRDLLKAGAPLDEQLGASFARWAAGDSPDAREKAEVLERIQGALSAAFPGKTGGAKAARQAAMRASFGVGSWRDVQGLTIERLRDGIEHLNPRPSATTGEQVSLPGEPQPTVCAAGERLSETQVRSILQLAEAEGVRLAEIEELYGCSLADIEVTGLNSAALELHLVQEIRNRASAGEAEVQP